MTLEEHFMKLVRVCPNPKCNPSCKGFMYYTTEKEKKSAERGSRVCASCRALGVVFSDSRKQKISAAAKRRLADPVNHPRYGVRLTDETKEKISKAHKGAIVSVSVREKISSSLKKLYENGYVSPHLGKALSTNHIEKLRKASTGKRKSIVEIRRMSERFTPELRRKMSLAMQGSGNPFFGKRHPMKGKCIPEERKQRIRESLKHKIPSKGSGGWGISGWYNGNYFRSSCELVFLMADHRPWRSAEKSEFRVEYLTVSGRKKSYYPDWYAGCEVVEIKPPNWGYQKEAARKKEAAELYFPKIGFNYSLIEVPILPKEKVFVLRNQGILTLNSHWERKYLLWKEGSCLVQE